jgi:hypothetical protein
MKSLQLAPHLQGPIPAARRLQTLCDPSLFFSYVDDFGMQAARLLFNGVPDELIRWWCTWFHEQEELEAADRDEAIEIIKYLVDKRIARTPGGPLSRAAEWYTQTLAPAAKRHNAVLAVKEKKIAQVTEIWGAGWQAIIDPGQLLFSSGN